MLRAHGNKCCSDLFYFERGVVEGDCLRPLLFAIDTETSAALMRQNSSSKGIKKGMKQHSRFRLLQMKYWCLVVIQFPLCLHW